MASGGMKIKAKGMGLPKAGIFGPAKTRGGTVAKTAISNALRGTSSAMKVDFGVTTRTWDNKPEFIRKVDTSNFTAVVYTESQIYFWLNGGTAPHIIRPKGKRPLTFWAGYRAKTTVRVIGSRKGGVTGNTIVYTRLVQHPGTEARHWDEEIANKWRKEFPTTLQRAIDAAFVQEQDRVSRKSGT